MCCTTVFGFIVGVVLFRVFRRYMAWRWGHGGGGCGGSFGHHRGGCGGHGHGFYRGSNAGYGWRAGSGFDPASGRGFGGSASNNASNNASNSAGQNAAEEIAASGRSIDDLVRGLELNQRQKDEAEPVFALIKQRLGVVGPRVDSALRVIASDRFDPKPLIAQLGSLPEPLQRELVDGLEHLHTILISEQREQLKRELSRR